MKDSRTFSTAAPLSSIAVLGGRGMLGSDLVRHLIMKGCHVSALDLPEFDITRKDDLEQAASGADAIVNCAAFTDVDGAETASETAFTVNARAVGELGKAAACRNIFVVHISTDFVFDGLADRPYSETDVPHPLSVYGRSKLDGERALEESGCHCAIMRVQWSYGENGVNFVSKLLQRAEGGGDLKVVDDQIGAPTWTADMAQAVECLLRERQRGLYHFANLGYASRYEVACFTAAGKGLSNRIQPCSSSDFPMKAVRPLNSRFDTTRIQAILDHPIRHWRDALSEFLRKQQN